MSDAANRTAGGGARGIAATPPTAPIRCPDHLERYRLSQRGERHEGDRLTRERRHRGEANSRVVAARSRRRRGSRGDGVGAGRPGRVHNLPPRFAEPAAVSTGVPGPGRRLRRPSPVDLRRWPAGPAAVAGGADVTGTTRPSPPGRLRPRARPRTSQDRRHCRPAPPPSAEPATAPGSRPGGDRGGRADSRPPATEARPAAGHVASNVRTEPEPRHRRGAHHVGFSRPQRGPAGRTRAPWQAVGRYMIACRCALKPPRSHCSRVAPWSNTTSRGSPDDATQIERNIYRGRVQNVLPGMGGCVHRHRDAQECVLYHGGRPLRHRDIESVGSPGQPRIEQLLRPVRPSSAR